MNASELANIPRWRGEPGFYEIWFLLVFEPGSQRAYWLRYTLFKPAPGVAGPAKSTVWMAWFDAAAGEPAVAFKNSYDINALDRGLSERFGIEIGPCRLGHGYASGSGGSDWHHIVWDLAFDPASEPAERSPRIAGLVPMPTTVARSHAEVSFSGRIQIDGVEHRFDHAPGLQYHIWGTRRVEELNWVYCPRFDDRPNAALEAYAVRPVRHLLGAVETPWIVPVYFHDLERFDATTAPYALTNRCDRLGPTALGFEAAGPLTKLSVRAWAELSSFVGYVYRDPGGQDLFVAHSDLANCEVEIFDRAFPLAPWRRGRRHLAAGAAALELHGPEPLEGVRYIPWDGDQLDETPAGGRSGDGADPKGDGETYIGERA